MENSLIAIIAVFTFVPIVVGILLGLLRGSRRALLRLILIVVCAVLAFVLSGAMASTVVETDVSAYYGSGEPMTLAEMLAEMLGEGFEGVVPSLMPFIQTLVKVMMFLVLFLLLQLITWLIVYPLCKLFVKPKKVTDANGNVKKKKRRLIGAAIGLVQGVAIALILCITFNGLFAHFGTLAEAMEGFSTSEENTASSDESEQSLTAALDDYNGSALGKIYNGIGEKPFEWISSVKLEDRTVTLGGQVEALSSLVKVGKELMAIADVDFADNFYDSENIAKLAGILERIEDIKGNLSDEAKITFKGMLVALGDMFGIDQELLNKFNELDLVKEAEAFEKLSAYKEKDFSQVTKDEVKGIITSLADSELMLDMLEGSGDVDLGNKLDDEHLNEIRDTLDEMVAAGDITEAKADQLREIFCLNGGGSNTEED